MTPAEIAAARALCEAATPGPWLAHGRHLTNYLGELSVPGDASFVAAARTGWPAALDEIERLTESLRIAESVRDDARQVAQRRLDETRVMAELLHNDAELRKVGA